mmetsp:Transcript_4976/g.10015  ORF Transcript_4976/g.10015 Transcript_4976/m.10015 type:complete len:80 (-) Transcript_4976:616-855(-)
MDEAENTPNWSVFTSQTFHSTMNTSSLPINQSDDIMEGETHNSVVNLGAEKERGRIIEHTNEAENGSGNGLSINAQDVI